VHREAAKNRPVEKHASVKKGEGRSARKSKDRHARRLMYAKKRMSRQESKNQA
jgi:hypothetical protein